MPWTCLYVWPSASNLHCPASHLHRASPVLWQCLLSALSCSILRSAVGALLRRTKGVLSRLPRTPPRALAALVCALGTRPTERVATAPHANPPNTVVAGEGAP